MAFIHSPKIITDGLVFALDGANPKSLRSGSNTWFDMSGRNNHGTIVGGTTYSFDSGGSLQMGQGNYITFGTSFPTASFTISMTFKITNITSSGFTYLILNGSNYATSSYYTEISNQFRTVGITFGNSSSYGAKGFTSAGPSNTGSTYEFTYTYDGTTCKLYRNGIFINQLTVAPPLPPTYLPSFGINGTYSPNGYIYRLLSYNRALTDTEVQQNYNTIRRRFDP